MSYLHELQRFLISPTDAHASIVLALTAVAVLIMLFIYNIALAAVTDLALGHVGPPALIKLGHPEYRLYAASLRFVLMMVIPIAMGTIICIELQRIVPGLLPIAEVLVVAGLLVLALRIGFLLPAVAMATRQGEVLRRSWVLSRGIFLRLLAIAVIMVLPGVVFEFLGETFGRMAGVFPVPSGGSTLERHILLFQNIAPAFAALLSLSALLILVMQAIASAKVYRVLVGKTPSAN